LGQAIFLKSLFPTFTSGSLLFRGSRDGFSAQTLLNQVDGIPNTVYVITSTYGEIFGGYMPDPRIDTNAGTWVGNVNAFLFSATRKVLIG